MNLFLRLSFHSDFSHVFIQPRECLRAAEVNTVKRLEQSFNDLKCQGILGLGEKKKARNVFGPALGGLPV